MDSSKELRLLSQHQDLEDWKEAEKLMDEIQKLRLLFPRGSSDFFKANETKTGSQLSHSNPKHYEATPLDRVATRKEKSVGRITLRYRLCRVRPLDPDGVAGSTKDITDGLCRCGLLPGDNPTQITLIVTQEQVPHYAEERTEIEIDYPEIC